MSDFEAMISILAGFSDDKFRHITAYIFANLYGYDPELFVKMVDVRRERECP